MQKRLTAALIIASLLSLPAIAAYNGPSADKIIKLAINTTKAIDNTPVELTGHLIKSLGDEKYLFRDSSGEAKVEIDDFLLRHIDVSEKTKVKLTGEIDDKWHGVDIDIDKIELLRQ